MPTIDDQIRVIDGAICRYLDNIDNSSRAVISQDILAHLKNLVEHVMLKYYSPREDIEDTEETFAGELLHTMVSIPLSEVAEYIKDDIKNGDDVQNLIPKEVLEYINENELYR